MTNDSHSTDHSCDKVDFYAVFLNAIKTPLHIMHSANKHYTQWT